MERDKNISVHLEDVDGLFGCPARPSSDTTEATTLLVAAHEFHVQVQHETQIEIYVFCAWSRSSACRHLALGTQLHNSGVNLATAPAMPCFISLPTESSMPPMLDSNAQVTRSKLFILLLDHPACGVFSSVHGGLTRLPLSIPLRPFTFHLQGTRVSTPTPICGRFGASQYRSSTRWCWIRMLLVEIGSP